MAEKRTTPARDCSPLDFNVRRDLLLFIKYAQERQIKRSYRDNQIPQGDRKRLAKLLNAPEPIREIEDEEGYWAEWICDLARRLGLASYATEGIYVGYTSQTESYPDNYISVNNGALKKYLALTSSGKERRILDVLINGNANEFYEASLLGTQERFDISGSAVGAASRMDLSQVRRRLLAILASYPTGQPVPFEELVERVQREEPNLIIDHERKPEKSPKRQAQSSRLYKSPQESPRPVYECLYEYRYKEKDGNQVKDWTSSREISEKEPDAFFRAEGRYLAYFLEEIPVLMQFVQLEYQDATNPLGLIPDPPNFIKSFTVTEKLGAVLNAGMANVDDVKVTISPDFTILVEALLYPDTVLARLAPYTTLKSSHHHTHILELSRKKTVETLTSNPNAIPLTDVLADVAAHSASQVPRNVAADIAEWIGHAEKCVVFEDVSLMEMRDLEPDFAALMLKELDDVVTHIISPRFAMVTSAADAFNRLEALEQVPASILHSNASLHKSLLPSGKKVKRARESKAKTETSLPEATWAESTMAAYTSNNLALLKSIAAPLRAQGVTPVLLDETSGEKGTGLLVVPVAARAKVNGLIRKLRASYDIRFQ